MEPACPRGLDGCLVKSRDDELGVSRGPDDLDRSLRGRFDLWRCGEVEAVEVLRESVESELEGELCLTEEASETDLDRLQ